MSLKRSFIKYTITSVIFPKSIFSGASLTSAENHQLANAEMLARENAAILMREYELTPDRILDKIGKALELRKEMVKRLSKFYVEDPSEKMTRIILETLKNIGKHVKHMGRERATRKYILLESAALA